MLMHKRLCQILTIIILLFIVVGSISASEEYTPVFHPELQVTKTNGKIKIDGFLKDRGWQGAAEANHFHEKKCKQTLSKLDRPKEKCLISGGS